jgi:hypothetical protein
LPNAVQSKANLENPMQTSALTLAFSLCLAALEARAVQDPALLCDQAADLAARMVGVPLDILRAISRVETGRDTGGGLTPWPWTMNVAGDGAFFDSADQALSRAEQIVAGGQENFDVGCFQLNYRWHGGAFPSLEAMFDPETNALYAANFLLTLYQSTGSWAEAIGEYHSQTNDLAQIYLAKVDGLLGGGLALPTGEPVLAAAEPDLRENNFPLLRLGGRGSGGSLVPHGDSRGSLFASGN